MKCRIVHWYTLQSEIFSIYRRGVGVNFVTYIGARWRHQKVLDIKGNGVSAKFYNVYRRAPRAKMRRVHRLGTVLPKIRNVYR